MTSLKLLYIRQSASDLKSDASWFQEISAAWVPLATTGEDPPVGEEQYEEESDLDLEELMALSTMDSGPPSPIGDTEDMAPGPNAEENAAVAKSGRWGGLKLLPETRRFASWAFWTTRHPVAASDCVRRLRPWRNSDLEQLLPLQMYGGG